MGGIHVLPTHLVNKIAAGEVIERPASVVKELVENALDAGATRIDVAVEDGGKRLIAVTDDGGGMSADDLALAFAPHATSKIAAEGDLEAIATMGFRGEALASIASVAHAHIRTRRPDDEGGFEVEASGERIGEVRPCAAAPGTTVTVRDLFFNTPARRKFLRTTNTEFAHVGEQIARLALPHAKVAFALKHNGREVQNLPPAESTAQRAADLFGRQLGEGLLTVGGRKGAVGVAGLIGRPDAARSSGRWQYFFLNGRYIRDRVLSHALREAYRGLLDPSRQPVAFLFLTVDPREVDVNVHPTKIEVRFRQSQLVHGELLAALRETLNRSDLTPDASLSQALQDEPAAERAAADPARRESLKQALADFFRSAPPPQPRLGFPDHHRPAPPEPPTAPARYAPAPPAPDAAKKVPDPFVAGAIQVDNTYIVAADAEGLLIVDQHALHERVLYNELKRRLADGRLASQRLLIPQTLNVSPGEIEALESHADLLGRLGLEVEPFGPHSVAVRRLPALLAERGVEPTDFVRSLLDALGEQPAEGEGLLESLLQMMACKAAIKAGQALSGGEIADLLARREGLEKGSSCPHGRPTTLRLTLKDLQKQFKRA